MTELRVGVRFYLQVEPERLYRVVSIEESEGRIEFMHSNGGVIKGNFLAKLKRSIREGRIIVLPDAIDLLMEIV